VSGAGEFAVTLGLYLGYSAPWCGVFAKSGKRWWVALVPVLNLFVLMRVARRPWWWALVLFVPLVDVAVWTVVCLDVAEGFGHGIPLAVGLVFVPLVFATWLWLGPSAFAGPVRTGPGHRIAAGT
jgi:hypothetical protein